MDDYFKMLAQHEDAKAKARYAQAEYESQRQAIQMMSETLAAMANYQTVSMFYLALNPNI